MSDRSTVIKKIVRIQEDWAVKLRYPHKKTRRKRVEDARDYVILFSRRPADIVCVDAVSTVRPIY